MTYRIHIRSALGGFLAEVQDLERAHTIHVEGRTLRDIMELTKQSIEILEQQKKERRVVCVHCGYDAAEHKAKTKECPAGTRTRIGFILYGPTTFSERKKKEHRENKA